MSDWIESDSLDDSQSAVLRNIVVPAFIIVGFESERPATTFHTAVKSLVALHRVDPPKAWEPGTQHESLADEVLDQLEVRGSSPPVKPRTSAVRSPGAKHQP